MIDRVFDGKDTSWSFSQRGLSDFQGQGPPTKNFHEVELLFFKSLNSQKTLFPLSNERLKVGP
jgi:hypothetical protein